MVKTHKIKPTGQIIIPDEKQQEEQKVVEISYTQAKQLSKKPLSEKQQAHVEKLKEQNKIKWQAIRENKEEQKKKQEEEEKKKLEEAKVIYKVAPKREYKKEAPKVDFNKQQVKQNLPPSKANDDVLEFESESETSDETETSEEEIVVKKPKQKQKQKKQDDKGQYLNKLVEMENRLKEIQQKVKPNDNKYSSLMSKMFKPAYV